MSGELKDQIKDLSDEELRELVIHANLLRKLRSQSFKADVQKCRDDTDKSNWLTVEEFELLVNSN